MIDKDTSQVKEWDLIIEGKSALFELKIKDIWRYRDLLILLVRRDFVSFYKQTVLGPLWFFIQPLFTTIVFAFIFGNLAALSTDGLPHFLFYMSGITTWNYFSDCLVKTSTVFKDNANIFGKVYFPRLIMPLSIVISNLVRFGVQFILLLLSMVFMFLQGYAFNMTWAVFLFPYLLLLMAMLGLGIGLIISALTTKYRDLSFLLIFGVQLMMYSTTVIFPLSSSPQEYRVFLELNPMTGIIEAFRFAFLGKGYLTWTSLIYSTMFAFISLILGVLIFNKTEKNFIDTI